MDNKDTLYRSNDPVSPFEFNETVAKVFPDMIKRSVPGYPLAISMISTIANQYVTADSHVYDLGCSLGAGCLAIEQGVVDKSFQLVAVDNSHAMMQACRETLKEQTNIEFVEDDVLNVAINNASMVVMNFTLQFVPVEQRLTLLKRIYQGLLPGGVLVLSEKIMFDDESLEQQMQGLHHRMKKLNGYNEMEIAGKRQALEKVLMPETIETHQVRLQQAGFNQTTLWLRCLNFISLLAIK